MSDRRDESSGGGDGARAQRKKQRRGGPAQQQQQHQRRQGTLRGRGQKNWQQRRQQESAGPSATFLAALEEQRENERRRQEIQQQQPQEHADELMDDVQQSGASAQSEQADQRRTQGHATGATAASAPPVAAAQRKPAHIAGFYYDESQKRYFKLTPQMKQRMKQSKQQRDAKEKETATMKALQARRERHSAVGARSTLRSNRGWIGCVAERESGAAWSAGRRDQRELVPRLFASTMATQELQPVQVDVSASLRRITALEFRSVSDYAAMGFVRMQLTEMSIMCVLIVVVIVSGGRLDIVRISVQENLRSGFAKRGERKIRVAEQVNVGMSYQISALKWRPDDSLAQATHLVCACVGGDSSSSSLAAPHSRRQNTGFVCLFKVCDGIEDIAQKWSFNDPWSVVWNPRDTGRFAIGLSGPICAAYVGVQAHDDVQNAPKGKIKSDVMAQAFSSDGNTILNGTRNGSMWLWDLRASRRAQEHSVPTTTAAASQIAGSVVDLHVLSDGFQVLVQKSNGELRLVDARKNVAAVVAEFAPGRKNTYLNMLKCAVDDTETAVVAAGRGSEYGISTVCSYEIRSGKTLSQIAVNKSQMSKEATPLEQVHLRARGSGSRPHERDAALPEIWALSRNELFVCEGMEQK